MPINYLRSLTGRQRTDDANRHPGRSLAFVASAANAGGFLAVGQYTSLVGLQNAIITKASKAEIRTTHITGLLTDIGFELDKPSYWNRIDRTKAAPPVQANRRRLLLLAALLGMFFIGGLLGALGFKYIGFVSTVPLAALLLLLAAVPMFDDLKAR